MQPRDLFRPRPRRTVSVLELLALDLGWPVATAARWAAFEAGIRSANLWTEREIEYLSFLGWLAATGRLRG